MSFNGSGIVTLEDKKRAFLGSLFVGLVCGAYNVLVDVGSLLRHNWWRDPFPSYMELLRTPHRDLHTPWFAIISFCVVYPAVVSLYSRWFDPVG